MQLALLAMLAVIGLAAAVPTSLEGRQICLPPTYCLLDGEILDNTGKVIGMTNQNEPCCPGTHCGSAEVGELNLSEPGLPTGIFVGQYANCEV